MAILKKPYEISIWEDEIVDSGTDSSYYKEKKIAIIGTDTMTAPSKAFSPVLHIKNNGEVTFTFSMAHRYYDPSAEEEVVNPFISYMVNERKVKLYYDGKWYDFLIKNHEEDSESNIWTFTLTDAFVNELSKVGYSVEFSTELNNNQGTAEELARETLKNTDWQVGESDELVQRVKEPMYIYEVTEGDLTVVDVEDTSDPKQEITVEEGEVIYVFYSYIANKNVKFVQFMREIDKPSFIYDSNNVIIGKNYRITEDVTYDDNEVPSFTIDNVTVSPVLEGGLPQYVPNQGFRLAYDQLTTYDPVMERTVKIYEIKDQDEGENQQVYSFDDSIYTTSTVLTSYITDGSDFNVYEDGSLEGWSNATVSTTKDGGVSKLQEIGLTTYPEVKPTVPLISLNEFSKIDGYLELKFDNPINSSYENTIYNSGFENNASFIERVLMGEEYVLRIAAATASSKHGELTPLNLATSTGKIRAVVAKYERIEERSGDKRQYVKRILPDGIVIDFDGDFVRDDVIVGDGVFNDSKTQYIIDGVVVEIPSTHCVYKDKETNEQRVWRAPTSESDTGSFVLLENADWFVGYYRTVSTAKMPLSNSWLTKPTNKIGIFLYVDNNDLCGGKYVYIADTQLTRCVRDGDNNIMSIGNVPTSVISTTPSYYQKPEKGQAAEDVDIYHELKDLASEIGCSPDDIVPVYNEKSEKILSISEAQSNCFNILQSICETFECWLKIDVKHNNDGSLKLDNNNKPIKQVCFKEYAGKDNFTGFKYGINLNSIQRTLNSDEIVTKLLVENVQSDYVDEGVMTIRNASTNPSGEANILNFDYYVNQGLIVDREKYQEDLNNYYVQMKEYNNELNKLEAERSALEVALTRTDSNRNVYTETVDVAQDKYQEAQDIFKDITGMTYDEYMNMYTVAIGDTFTDNGASGDPAIGTIVELGYTTYNGVYYRFIRLHCATFDRYSLYKRKDNQWIRVFRRSDESRIDSDDVTPPSTTGDSKEYNIPWRRAVANSNDDPDGDHGEIELIDHEEIIDTIGQLYTSLSIINNYAGSILVNTDEEYERYRSKLEGYPDYKFTVSYVPIAGEEGSYEVRLVLNDYIKGFAFKTYVNGGAEQEFESSVSKKSFVATYDSVGENPTFTFKVTSIPENYEPVNFALNTSYAVANGIKGYTIKSNNTEVIGYKDKIKQVQDQKDACEKEFYKKYSRFIKEGTWSSNDYIDPELYYLDAIQVSQTSAFPKVEYSINVAEVSELEGLENYKFDVGDKTYIEDTDFFGWAAFYVNNDSQIATLDRPDIIDEYVVGKTPAREEVIVAEVEWHLDEPETNVITVQNYKTQFEDLFQRISATVQQAQYNEATYAKTSSIIDANGTINQGVLLNSLNGLINSNYTLTSNGSVIVDNDGILIRDLNDTSNRVRIDSFGLKISRDGGQSWITAINGDGINLNRVVSGELNTKAIRIGNPDNPSFCWDDYGISAYRYNTTAEEEDSPYDLTTFVRYDQYGLYGIKNDSNFKASKLDDILDKAYFGVTWDGFFIKNSYEGGGRVEITSDNDFRVLTRPANSQTEQEKIKIGALEWIASGYRLTEDMSPIDGKTYYIYNSADDIYSVSTPPDPIPSDTYYEYFNNEVTTEPQIDSAPTKYGIRIKNDAGEPVFTTDDNGNIIITGTIDALGGNFSKEVTVGKNSDQATDYITIDGEDAEIYSSNYYIKSGIPQVKTETGLGWMINKSGNAVFNNVSVRGTIKSAVFEYNQIQAVGGTIYIRPSTAISKVVSFANDDLIIEVEDLGVINSAGDGDVYNFCKIGNDNSCYLYTIVNGQVHLLNYGAGTLPVELEGTAFIALGCYDETLGDTTKNYGIGLNSSNMSIGIPSQAITLMESECVEDSNNTISVNNVIKGVFGTLPVLDYSAQSGVVAELYHNYLENKQGIYTDNIYIGDANQYLAFYTDTSGQTPSKKLAIRAGDIGIEAGGNTFLVQDLSYKVYITINESTKTLTAHVYYLGAELNTTQIIQAGLTFAWYAGYDTTSTVIATTQSLTVSDLSGAYTCVISGN